MPNYVIEQKDIHETSPGELKAIWREKHLCLRCIHQTMCKIGTAIDAHLFIVISQCLAFIPQSEWNEKNMGSNHG